MNPFRRRWEVARFRVRMLDTPSNELERGIVGRVSESVFRLYWTRRGAVSACYRLNGGMMMIRRTDRFRVVRRQR